MPGSLWKGIEIIKHFAGPSEIFGESNVYIGEIGLPEQGKDRKNVFDWWDRAFAAMLSQEVPYILHWQLYCNESTHVDRHTLVPGTVLEANQLRGFWLIRPDGSYGYAAEYILDLLDLTRGRF